MDESQVGEGHPEEKPEETPKDKPLDLSVPQVAGSAVAAVVAAKLASNLGVYGTITGAGVVSALGTCGGSIFHYVFRRTGRHMHDVAVQAKPKVALPPLNRGKPSSRPLGRTRLPGSHAPERTRATGDRARDRTAGPEPTDPDGASALSATAPEFLPVEETDATRPLTGSGLSPQQQGRSGRPSGREWRPADGEFNEGTLHRARGRGWKRPLVAVVLVFGLAMGGITAYEAASGNNISGSGNGTTFGDVFSGGGSSHSRHSPSGDTPTGGPTTPSGGATPGDGTHSSPATPPPSSPGRTPDHRGPSNPPQTPSSPSNPGGGAGTSPGTGSGGTSTQSPTPPSTPTPPPSTGNHDVTRNSLTDQGGSTSEP